MVEQSMRYKNITVYSASKAVYGNDVVQTEMCKVIMAIISEKSCHERHRIKDGNVVHTIGREPPSLPNECVSSQSLH